MALNELWMHGTTEYNSKAFLSRCSSCSKSIVRQNLGNHVTLGTTNQKLRHFRWNLVDSWENGNSKWRQVAILDFYHNTKEINNVKHAV